MRDEQREAIDTLKEITENDLLNYWEGTERPYNAIQIVLSLIKEQQEEIEKLKVNLAKSCADRTLDRETLKNQENENLEALHRAYNEELDKKNKQIDLMADKLVEAHEWFYSEFDNFTKEDFIKYFADKAKGQ